MVRAQLLKPVVVLKNCEAEFSCILAKLFNMCPKESCFFDCWKISSVVPVFKDVGERSLQLLKKRGLFSHFQYGFRSSRSTAYLLTVASATVATAFNRSVAAGAVALDTSNAFGSV